MKILKVLFFLTLISPFLGISNHHTIKMLSAKKEAERYTTIQKENVSYLETDLYFLNDNITIFDYYIDFYIDFYCENDYIISVEAYFDMDLRIRNYDVLNTGYQPNITQTISLSSGTTLFGDDLLIPITNLDNGLVLSNTLLNVPTLELDGGMTMQLLPILRIGNTTINSQLFTFYLPFDDTLADIFTEFPILYTNYSQGDLIRLKNTNLSSDSFNLANLKDYWSEIGFESGLTEGYDRGSSDGYELGFEAGFSEGLNANNFMNTIRQLFATVSDVMQVEILPNIRLWYIVGVPLVLSVVRFILGWWR